MTKRKDIHKVLIIGQACEFDYSGTQACREKGILNLKNQWFDSARH